MSFTPFDPNSPRAIAGLNFQQKFFEAISSAHPEVRFEMTWDHFKSKDNSLNNKQLAILEKEFGDITYVMNGERHYIECCFVMGKKLSRLCEMKRIKFHGENKWYCYGFAECNDVVLIPSLAWKKYTSKIKKRDRSCRMVPISSILGIKAGSHSIENYWENVHNCL